MRELGKHGITGNTGVGVMGFAHVSAPYDSLGGVFVECDDYGWERMTSKKAERLKSRVILCGHPGCDKPAVRLDHLWPHYNEMNACEQHAK